MKIDFEGARLYVRPGSTDLRKGVTGLLAIIENEMHLDALSNSVFFFCNKSHKLLKIIFWNKTGFWLAQKRLEMATWPWPNTSQEAREFASKTESLKKLYESQPFLFDAEEMGIKVENQCPEISDEDIALALKDDDLFDRKSEKKKPGRTRNKSKNLPRQKYVIDLSEEEKICSNCGTKMVKVREIVSERIVHVPSSEYIEEVHRYVYECQNCLDDNDKPVRKAAKEKRIIEHSIATPELLAHIFISKYMKHTPFYCLEDTYNWQGICISRQNMCKWSLKVHERLKPLETLLNSELKKTKLLMFDESPVEVLKVDPEELKAEYWDEARYRKKADDIEDECRKNCYMWVVLGGTKEHPVSSYNFR